MLPPAMEGKIEDTVDLNLKYPSVIERYWTKHYFIPKEKKKPDTNGDDKGTKTTNGGVEESTESVIKDNGEKETIEKMEIESNGAEKKDDKVTDLQDNDRLSPNEEGVTGQQGHKTTYSSLDNSGHVCVMIHTNKICLVTLSPKHPALAPGQEITKVGQGCVFVQNVRLG